LQCQNLYLITCLQTLHRNPFVTSDMATEKFGLLCYATGSKEPPLNFKPRNTKPHKSIIYKGIPTISGVMQTIPSESDSRGCVLPEIHLNIWEQEISGKEGEGVFLDIGLMFSINESAKTIELIFPWKVSLSEIKDLSGVIGASDAIPAIFNESWVVSDHCGDYVVHDPRQATGSGFSIVSIDKVLSEQDHEAQWGTGSTLKTSTVHAISVDVDALKMKAKSAAEATNRDINRFYIRFRVLNVRKNFYCSAAGDVKFDMSTVLQQKTEDLDFRLNVRRGAPPNLAKSLGKFLEFSKVHLFLMRSRDKDIVFHDKLFKAARSLEDEDFWARYSLKDPAAASQGERDANLNRVKKNLGYQWKSGGDGQPSVKEFGTLARFRIVKVAVWPFILWALALGVSGNILLELAKLCYSKWRPDGPVEAVCIKAGEGFTLPKQECVPSAKIDSAKGRFNGQTLKKD